MVRETDEQGSLEVYLPRQDVCVTIVEGRLTLAMAERWMDVLERQFRLGACFDTFHDWDAMSGYDSAARTELTRWVLASLKNIKSAHFLVHDRMVRMGVTSANVATSFAGLRMTIYSEREKFESELSRRLSGRNSA